MLIKCPECELQVSNKALNCPHCGYPIDSRDKKKRTCNPRKRIRLPNGFGRITELNNPRLRKRFRVMVSVGKDSTGKPIGKLLKPNAYFETYNDAYAALIEYNKNPYDLDNDITVMELYEKWSEEYFKTLKNPSSIRTITSAWAYCSSIYNMRAKDLRARHIKGCMEEGRAKIKGVEKEPTAGMKSRIKSMFNLMFDYAVEYEIVDKNYARTFNVSDDILDEKEETKKAHIPFTDDEIQKLWDNIDTIPYADIVIIQIYSGWRPQELGLIELKNVDIENWTFKGGMKTEAGTDRIVPIHSKIQHLVKARYEEALKHESDFLFNCIDTSTHKNNYKLTYDKYKYRFDKIVSAIKLNPEHRPHDPRMHFITMAKKAGINDNAIKKIVGHSSKDDVTEYVYTIRDIEWLRRDIEKIK